MLAVEAIRQVAGLAINHRSENGRYPVPQKLEGPPVELVLVGGWFSPGSGYMRNISSDALTILPEGSTTSMHSFITGINLAVGVPWPLRQIEVMRVADAMKKGADRHGRPVIGIGHSLGGILLVDAWTLHPDEANGMQTTGSPHLYPIFGNVERPAQGTLYTTSASRDLVVAPWATRHRGEDRHTRVRGGHFSLTVSPEGVGTLMNGLVDIYNREYITDADKVLMPV